MNPRTTLILLVVAAALGGLIYLYEIRGGEARRLAEQAEKRLFAEVAEEDVREIVLVTNDDHTARLERVDGAWRVREPVDFPGDPVAIDGIASNLAELESKTLYEESQELEVYGLGEGARVIRFAAGERDYELRVGDKTPVGSETYVSTGHDPRVFTVESFKVTSMTRSLDDLRERRPLRFDREGLDHVEVEWPDGGVELEKRDEAWYLTRPLEARADETTLDTFLSDLTFLRASGFVDDPPPDAELGLDRPAYRVALHAGDESHELVVGDTALEDGSRAARAAEPILYKIADSRLDAFPKRVVEFRFKQLSQFLASDAERLELVFHDPQAAEAGTSQIVTITAEREESGWVSAPETLAAGKAARIVSELSDVRAEDIASEAMSGTQLAEAGLAPPSAIVRVFGEGGPLAQLQLGRIDPEKGLYAQVSDRPIVYLLDDTLAEHVPVSLEALRNRFLTQEEPAEG